METLVQDWLRKDRGQYDLEGYGNSTRGLLAVGVRGIGLKDGSRMQLRVVEGAM